MSRTDYELLAAWSDGDAQAGNELFLRHFDSVERFFRNKVDGSAQDLVQEVFLACVAGRDRFRRDASFRTYLFRIARNKLCDHYRARYSGRLDFTTTSAIDLGASPSAVAAKREEQALLLRALRSIPLDHQIALELFYWEGMRSAELAEVLDLNPNTVRSRLQRAKENLKEAIRKASRTAEVAEQTITNLEDWAAALRAEISPTGEPPGLRGRDTQ